MQMYVIRRLAALIPTLFFVVFPSIWWGWSPELKYVAFWQDPARNLAPVAVPAVILGTSLSAVTMRLTRTMLLEVLRQDYIRTALAKGLSERLVVVRHALRNALIPVVTLVGLKVPLLIGGAVIMAQIFVIPGRRPGDEEEDGLLTGPRCA